MRMYNFKGVTDMESKNAHGVREHIITEIHHSDNKNVILFVSLYRLQKSFDDDRF